MIPGVLVNVKESVGTLLPGWLGSGVALGDIGYVSISVTVGDTLSVGLGVTSLGDGACVDTVTDGLSVALGISVDNVGLPVTLEMGCDGLSDGLGGTLTEGAGDATLVGTTEVDGNSLL